MKICMSCKWEAPDNTLFCGQCGQKFIQSEDASTGNSITRSSGLHVLFDEKTPASTDATFISSNNEEKTVTPSGHNMLNRSNTPIPGKDEDLEHEILHPFDDLPDEHAVTIISTTPYETKKSEDEDAFVPFPLLLENAPTPLQNNILAQGQLHIDQVPYGPAPHISQPTPPPPHPAQLFQYAPMQRPATVSPPSPQHRQNHPSVKHHQQRQHHLQRHHIRPTCLVVVVLGFIAFSILGLIIIFFPKPTPTLAPIAQLVGEPIPGQKMILHGGRFVPGETVTILIDYKLTASTGSFSSNSMSIGGLFSQRSPAGIKEVVSAGGTFSLTITVDPRWAVGSVHTVSVYKQDGTLIKLPPFVVITPSVSTGLTGCLDETTAIKLGPISEASTQPISKTITLCTQGSGLVNWTAYWGQKWLTFPSSGRIQAPQEGKLTISASAKGLKAGAYTTTIMFSSRQSANRVPLQVVLVIVKAGTSTVPTPSTQSQSQAISCISVAPQSISFTNIANQATLLSKDVDINNCGDTGQWTASITTNDGKPWLGIGLSQGTIRSGWFQGVAITASSAMLSPGQYSAVVTFHLGPNSTDVRVTFTVRPQKTLISCIDATPRSLTFVSVAGQNDPPAQSVVLTNCGATGQWSISPVTNDGIDWIHLSRYSDVLKQDDRQQFGVTVSSAQLEQGAHFGQLIVSMGTSSVKINITFIVEKACIHIDYPSLLFKSNVGDSALQDIVTITNCGSAGLWYGSASTDDGANWLTIDRVTGQLQPGASQRIAVDVSGVHLREGSYTGNILFIMGVSQINVRVKFIIVKPDIIGCISVNTNSLAFTTFQGENPDSQVVTIGNCGDTKETWTASLNGTAWMTTDVSQGTFESGDAQDVRISLSSRHLALGRYTGHITFSAGSSSKEVQIELTVQERIIACITANPLALAFSSTIVDDSASTPKVQTVQITNCGSTGSLSATPITDDGASWLGTTLANKSLDVAATSSVAVAVDSSGLHVGSYSATIPFTLTVSTGAQAVVNVRVQLNITQQTSPSPCTSSPSPLTFSSTWGEPVPSAQNVILTACGANDTWSASNGSDGLFNLDAYSGTLDDKGNQVVSVIPDGHGFYPGQYTHTFTFVTGSGETTSVNATWNILQPPNSTCIQVDSSSLNFPDQSGNSWGAVSFLNCGAYPGNIAVTESTSTGWLTISPYGNSSIDGSNASASGYGPSVSVNADSTNLIPGPHSGTITGMITTAQGSKSVAVSVTFTVPTPTVPPVPTPVPTDTPVVATDTPTDTPIVSTGTPTDTSTVSIGTPTDTPTVCTSTPTDTPIVCTTTPTDTPIVCTTTPTDTPTDTPVVTPTDTPIPTPTDTPVVTPTDTPVVTPTDTPIPTSTDTPVPPPTDTPIPTPTDTPVVTPTDTPIPTPTDTPIPTPTDTPVPTPTDTPVPPPTDTPTPGP